MRRGSISLTPAKMLTITDLGPIVWSLQKSGICVQIRNKYDHTVLVYFGSDPVDRPSLGISYDQARELLRLLNAAVASMDSYWK
jgi:hypothetical protein